MNSTLRLIPISLFYIFLSHNSFACTQVDKLVINQPGVIIESYDVQRLKDENEHKCLTAEQITDISKKLTVLAYDRGYALTTVEIKPKSKNSRELVFEVFPARVNKSNALKEGQYLNIRDLEQQVDQIKKLPGFDARSNILPGKEPYTSDVDIVVTEQKFGSASLTHDNHGTKGGGINQTAISLQKFNTLGIYDTVSLNYQHGYKNNPRHPLGKSLNVGVTIPWNYWTYKLTGSSYRFAKKIPSIYFNMPNNYTGATYNITAEVEKLVHRNQFSKTHVSASGTFKDSSNYISGSIIDTQSKKLTILSFKVSNSLNLPVGSLASSANFQKGIHGLGADKRKNTKEPNPSFGKFLLNLGYSAPFEVWSQNFSFDSAISAQFSGHILYDTENIGIGGESSVRSFRESQFSGEEGWYIRNNFTYYPQIPYPQYFGVTSIYAGFDYGEVNKNRQDKNMPHTKAAGGIIGIRNNHKYISLEASFAKPWHAMNPAKRGSLTLFSIGLNI